MDSKYTYRNILRKVTFKRENKLGKVDRFTTMTLQNPHCPEKCGVSGELHFLFKYHFSILEIMKQICLTSQKKSLKLL